MIDEIHVGHLVFGVFPRVGGRMYEAYHRWAANSVGDVLNMFMQALEVSSIRDSQTLSTHEAPLPSALRHLRLSTICILLIG